MREIKFRAWDGDTNVVTPEATIQELINRAVERGRNVINWEALTLMQYTGLKDKNGKEIFEGDIVNYSEHPAGMATVEWNERGYFELVFPSGAKNFIPDKHLFRMYGFEVIGNIYDNPELIQSV